MWNISTQNIVHMQYSAMEPSFKSGDVFLATLPWFHIYGMVVVLHAGLYRGVKLVALPAFSLEAYLSLVQVLRAAPRASVFSP